MLIEQYILVEISGSSGREVFPFSNEEVLGDVQYDDGRRTQRFSSETGKAVTVSRRFQRSFKFEIHFTGSPATRLKYERIRELIMEPHTASFEIKGKGTSFWYETGEEATQPIDGIPDRFDFASIELPDGPTDQIARGAGRVVDKAEVTVYESRDMSIPVNPCAVISDLDFKSVFSVTDGNFASVNVTPVLNEIQSVDTWPDGVLIDASGQEITTIQRDPGDGLYKPISPVSTMANGWYIEIPDIGLTLVGGYPCSYSLRHYYTALVENPLPGDRVEIIPSLPPTSQLVFLDTTDDVDTEGAAASGKRMIVQGDILGTFDSDRFTFTGTDYILEGGDGGGGGIPGLLGQATTDIRGSNIFIQDMGFSYGWPFLNLELQALLIGEELSPADTVTFKRCFFTGGTAESVRIFGTNVIFEDCIFANPLSRTEDIEDPANASFWVGVYGDNVSFHGCIFMNGKDRAPFIQAENVFIGNCTFYNSQSRFIHLRGTNGPVSANVIGNYFIPGSLDPNPICIHIADTTETSSIYMTGNVSEAGQLRVNDESPIVFLNEPISAAMPAGWEAQPAADAYQYAIDYAGPQPRPSYVNGVVSQIQAGTGTIFYQFTTLPTFEESVPEEAPGGVVLDLPLPGSTGQPKSLTFSWAPASGSSPITYTLQVTSATDGQGNPDYAQAEISQAGISGTSYAAVLTQDATEYFWRVWASNAVWDGSASEASFTTAAQASLVSILPPPPSTSSTSNIAAGDLSGLKGQSGSSNKRFNLAAGNYTGANSGDSITFSGDGIYVKGGPSILRKIYTKAFGSNQYYENMGFVYGWPYGLQRDCLSIGNPDNTGFRYLYFKNCFFSGGTDELVGDYGIDVIFEDCIFANPLSRNQNDPTNSDSHAFWVATRGDRTWFHRCLFANGQDRGPLIREEGHLAANCLFVNTSSKFITIKGDSGPVTMNIVNNRFVTGGLDASPTHLNINDLTSASALYIAGNQADGGLNIYQNSDNATRPGSPIAEGWPSNFTPRPASEVFDLVLDNAGPQPRPSWIADLVSQIRNNSGNLMTIFWEYPSTFPTF